jgi:hypothetical protein
VIIKFKDILPNPYRDLVRNPLNEETVENLRVSVRKTGFWNNVEVRKSKEKPGKYELAYGHHRLEAAKREGLTEANFIVLGLTEADMVVRKHKEDRTRKAFDALTMMESVRAVVKALAEGEIPAFEVSPDTPKKHVRIAPSFVGGAGDVLGNPQKAYTAFSIAEFLDETESGGKDKARVANAAVRTALDALALIEQQEFSEASLKNVPLDNPSGDSKKMGLIQKVQIKKAQIETRQELTKAQQERSAADAKRREEEAKERERKAELIRKERVAQAEENTKKIKAAAEARKQEAERAEQRAAEFKAKRVILDAKVEEAQERAEAAKTRDKDLPTRHAVKAMLFTLHTITSETFAFREKVKAMSRDKTVTTNERELLRQAMLDAGEWYIEQANLFLPKPVVNVLAEAAQKEESKRKRKADE